MESYCSFESMGTDRISWGKELWALQEEERVANYERDVRDDSSKGKWEIEGLD